MFPTPNNRVRHASNTSSASLQQREPIADNAKSYKTRSAAPAGCRPSQKASTTGLNNVQNKIGNDLRLCLPGHKIRHRFPHPGGRIGTLKPAPTAQNSHAQSDNQALSVESNPTTQNKSAALRPTLPTFVISLQCPAMPVTTVQKLSA